MVDHHVDELDVEAVMRAASTNSSIGQDLCTEKNFYMFDIVYFKKNLQSLKYKIKKKPSFFYIYKLFNLGLSESEIKNICKILSKELSSFKKVSTIFLQQL